MLEFPGGSPAGLSKAKIRTPIDNPYGRREAGVQRTQEEDLNDNPRRRSTGADVPLANWEADKIPMVCYEHRAGNSCRVGAQKCPFMHRNKDPDGRDYPVVDGSGYVPPKYRYRPLTCPYWLKGAPGCYKSEEDCNFAHKITGWTPGPGEEALPISPDQIRPREENKRRPSQPAIFKPKGKNLPPSELTCWFWKHKKCNKPEEVCEFQHRDTGIVANVPPNIQTCHDWEDGDRCPNSARECRNLHSQIGVMSGNFDKKPGMYGRLSCWSMG